MYIVHVFIHVKPACIESFKQATIENARNSLGESGIARFDIVQHHDEETKFVLIEVYRSAVDPARHKETDHYKRWRDTVEPMMAEPRTNTKYLNVFPDEMGWNLK